MKQQIQTLWPLAVTIVAFPYMGHADTQPTANTIINCSGRPQVDNGANLFLTADWLLWQANETGLGFAVKTDTDSSITLGEGSVKSPAFTWTSGFRVGLGYNTPHDGWDLYLNWTWFQDKASKSLHTDGDDFLYPAVIHPANAVYALEAESKLHLHVNMLDLGMGREYEVSTWSTLKPFVGLRTAFVNQHNNIEYDNVYNVGINTLRYNDYEVERECNYWGLGIRTGLDTQWELGRNFSLYANAAVSLLYGFFHVEHEEEQTLSSTGVHSTNIDLVNSYRAARAITDLQLGLRWDYLSPSSRYHLGIQAGWEQHLFFSQNQFMDFVDDTADGVFVQNQGDLELQGWTIAMRFDF